MPQRVEGPEPGHGITQLALDRAGVIPLCVSRSVPSTGCSTTEHVASSRCLAPIPTSRSLAPGWPITLEVHCAGVRVALVRGVVDSVPWLAGEIAQRVVVRDAVVRCSKPTHAPPDDWRRRAETGERILVTLPDGQLVRCRVLIVDEDGSMQLVLEHEVVVR
jgi:hypothetical protein